MTQYFGNTWWGKEWLRALTHIDYENRIPRGASYARNGAVKCIELKGNVIRAKIMGHNPHPYTVSIVIPPFSETQAEKLMQELMARPGIISRLLNHELDTEVMSIANSCGMKIFPERWTDLQMDCDCPDWAVPCKHLAAVVYMFSREIDNNPFIVFEMHGMNLLEELEKRGIRAEKLQEETEVPTVRHVAEIRDTAETGQTPPFRRIDFTRLNDCTDALLALLPDNPSFAASINFKGSYVAELQRIRKIVRRFLDGRLTATGFIPCASTESAIKTDTAVRMQFDCCLNWTLAYSQPGLAPQPVKDHLSVLSDLLLLNSDFLPDYHPTVIALHQSFYCALHLLAQGTVAPQLLQLADNTYAMRWQPAYIDRRTALLLNELEGLFPNDMVNVLPTPRQAARPVMRPAEWAVSFCLGLLMKHFVRFNARQPYITFFFTGQRYAFNAVGEQETPGSIKAWTAAYTLAKSDYRPILRIEENETEGFDLHIGIEDKTETPARAISLYDILHAQEHRTERFRMLHCFTLISTLMPELSRHINQGAEKPLHYTLRTFAPFLMQVVPVVRILDIKVSMPKSLQNLIRPKAAVSLSRKPDSTKGFFSLADLFQFNWEVALGNDTVTADEFMRLCQQADGLIRFKENYIYVSADDLKKLHNAFSNPAAAPTPEQLLQAALTEEYQSAPVRLSDEARELARQLTTQEDIAQPAGLHATLRPYQERGFSWMYRNMRIGFGSILADDMGLGKTLQAITLMLKLKEEGDLQSGHVLVVVPTGLLANWQAEISRFAPSLSVSVYHGASRDLSAADYDVLLTTYGVLRSDAARLKKKKWAAMFIDEAQNIKNQDTAQSKAVRSIPAGTHIALSGTPVENRLSEFWSIMEYANKGYLGSLKSFKETFARPIQYYNDAECARRFRQVTAPFMMRRMKTDKSIICDLPEKIELNDYAALTSAQAALYDKTLDAAMQEIRGITSTDHESLFKRQGLILQIILALKQICNHPAQYLKNKDFRAELSGKAEMLLTRVESIVDSGEKVLVFTQFREMGSMLARFIEEQTGIRPLFYHGGCSVKQRQEMVDRFQNNRPDKVFILSLKAAGTGLNLTAASHVIHYDLWWNPAVEAQATDRAYRIGQQKNVVVHRFITKDTFEERINDMIQQKKHLADMTVASGESWIGKLSNKELEEIFRQ